MSTDESKARPDWLLRLTAGILVVTGLLLAAPAGGHAAPMTFYSKRSGRQFVVIPASGHFLMKSGQADYLVAYALPRT